ncbi:MULTISPECIES: SCO2400 family protein [unclassified Streptomyces]|uniref:SCO2400 family protein n=1 Tax=unclassified Streptomyces TaxID=2593676 RepID=UPI0024B63ED3|nr:hypothetical protein [Streptomyces sp. KAU_LT]MDI9833256.1 hypothetical protein [Streptomyces sp. KAU_LT]
MDYCSSCRRHLNGALVCPGCGAYAPDIAPSVAGPAQPAVPGPAASGRHPSAGQAPFAGQADTGPWFDASFHDGTARAAGPAEDGAPDASEGVEGSEAVTAAPQGRAARRRRRARWKKNQRRAVVATAVALVGGGLTLTSLDRQSGDRAQAATAPEQPHTDLSGQRQQIEPPGPAATVPDGPEAPRAHTPTARPTATDVAREPMSSSHTTRRLTRPDAASTPDADSSQAPRTQPSSAPATTAPATGGGTSSGGQRQTPDPTPTDEAGSGSTQAPNDPRAPQDTTSPAQLCVLNLLCLG